MDQRPRLSGLLHIDVVFAPWLVSRTPRLSSVTCHHVPVNLREQKILPVASVRAKSQQEGLVERLARLSKSGCPS